MHTKNLVLLAQIYHYWVLKNAAEKGSLEELVKLETFKDRVDYAEKHWKHLSSGSSRVIYLMDDGKVLKLAKNKRGIAQNLAESNPKMKSKYINPTLKYDKDGVWKISPYLDKITEKDFEELTGLDFKEFGEAIEYGLHSVSHSEGDSDDEPSKPKNFEEVSKSDIYKELVEVAKKFELMPGDLSRISSWAGDKKHPVLLDTGLNYDIWEEFYND